MGNFVSNTGRFHPAGANQVAAFVAEYDRVRRSMRAQMAAKRESAENSEKTESEPAEAAEAFEGDHEKPPTVQKRRPEPLDLSGATRMITGDLGSSISALKWQICPKCNLLVGIERGCSITSISSCSDHLCLSPSLTKELAMEIDIDGDNIHEAKALLGVDLDDLRHHDVPV